MTPRVGIAGLTCLLLLVGSVRAQGAELTNPKAKRAKAAFDEKMKKAVDAYHREVEKAQRDYAKELEQIKADVMRAGDLDEANRIDDEVSGLPAPHEPPSLEPKEITNLAKALTGSRWKFKSPKNSGVLSFGADHGGTWFQGNRRYGMNWIAVSSNTVFLHVSNDFVLTFDSRLKRAKIYIDARPYGIAERQ